MKCFFKGNKAYSLKVINVYPLSVSLKVIRHISVKCFFKSDFVFIGEVFP